MPSIATIINYCTNDFRFIDRCIQEAKLFSNQILIPVCDHFFDGSPENRELLHHTYARHPDCTFIEFPYLPDRLYSQYHNIKPSDTDWSMFWGTTGRYISFLFLDADIDTVLFLDSDEVFEGKAFLEWLETKEHESYEAMRLAAYYYALKPTFRAKNVVNLPLLAKKEAFKPLTLFNEIDRLGAYMTHAGPKREKVVGVNGLPFVHHYSWVRTKEECLQKARTWGHRHDEDWPKLIEEAFNGKTDRLFGSTHQFFEIEKGYFDPLDIPFPTTKAPKPGPHVQRISERDVRIKEIENALL
ncbi:MAG: hypothetical protein K1X28_07575 [Parachlamydiales bacterium]|nr:hypothetical protein [Parachlamydiales bacterium]